MFMYIHIRPLLRKKERKKERKTLYCQFTSPPSLRPTTTADTSHPSSSFLSTRFDSLPHLATSAFSRCAMHCTARTARDNIRTWNYGVGGRSGIVDASAVREGCVREGTVADAVGLLGGRRGTDGEGAIW